jgi:hypothetical protein
MSITGPSIGKENPFDKSEVSAMSAEYVNRADSQPLLMKNNSLNF